MKRTFIAIKIPVTEELNKVINHFHNELEAERIKWVETDNMHISLSFLGDTEEGLISSIANELQTIADSYKCFSFKLTGAGVFPPSPRLQRTSRNIQHPRVLWLGIIEDENNTLMKLGNDIKDRLELLGFEKEKRKFKAHLTLGRVKSINKKEKLKNLLEKYQNQYFQNVDVQEIIFYESILTAKGPVYKVIRRFKLKSRN